MRMKLLKAVLVLSCVALGPLALAGAKVGQPAPKLEVSTFDAKTFNLAKLRGKPVVVHFWATWCPACRREMPVLSHFYQKNRGRLEMLALSADRPREREAASKMMRELAFPGGMLDEADANDFGKPGTLPMTYVIDAQGSVSKIFSPDSESGEDELNETNLSRSTGLKTN
jgi:thiol-disulfide isomerase/thioredoxin